MPDGSGGFGTNRQRPVSTLVSGDCRGWNSTPPSLPLQRGGIRRSFLPFLSGPGSPPLPVLPALNGAKGQEGQGEVESWTRTAIPVLHRRGKLCGSAFESLRHEDDFSEHLAGKHQFLSLAGFGQGKDRVHDRPDVPCLDEPAGFQEFGTGSHV